MANRRPSSSRTSGRPSGGDDDDAFVARVLHFVAWARDRTEVVIALVVVLVLVVGGAIYWMNQRTERTAQAASELESIQQTLVMGEPDEAEAELRDFLTRFGGTPYAVEGRLALAQHLLEQGEPDEAIAVLEEVAPSFDDPLRLQATILLAVALEEAEDWERAEDVYARLSRDAEFSYQRREATEGAARVHLAQGDTASAIEAYRSLLAELDQDHEQRGYYEMRLAELTGGRPS